MCRTAQHRKRHTYVYALSGIQTHDPSVQADEDKCTLDQIVTGTGTFSITVTVVK